MIAGASNEATVLFWSDMGVKDCSGSRAVWRYPLTVDESDDMHCTRTSEHDCSRVGTCVVHIRHKLAFSPHYESAVPMFYNLCVCPYSAPGRGCGKSVEEEGSSHGTLTSACFYPGLN
jgi:hypothetical protein